MPPIYDRIDEASIEAQVRAFYGRARHDSALGPVFEAAVEDWEAHFGVLTRFWSSAMLTSGAYSGDPVAAHRRQPTIRPEHFAIWLRLWGETADALFAPEHAPLIKTKAERIGRSLELALFFRQ